MRGTFRFARKNARETGEKPMRYKKAGRPCVPFIVCVFLFFFSARAGFGLTEEERSNIEIYQKSARGVVNITSIAYQYDFAFNPIPREGSGSGVVLDRQGHILTNRHVIKDARRIVVTLNDKSKYPGSLVGFYPDYDLAVIAIKAPPEKLFPIPSGSSSDLLPGQKVLAIGNPFGIGVTLTTGVISSVGRSIRTKEGYLMEDLIQHDAAINPGNSGGPLLDSEGRLVGINTAILSPSGGSIGIGFAVPVDVVKRVVPELIQKGRVAYPWIGLTVFPLVPGLSEVLGLSVDDGLLVIELSPGGPAQEGGIQGPARKLQIGNVILPVGGDVIIALDGRAVKTSEEFVRLLRKHRPQDVVLLKILRGGRLYDIRVKLGERPAR